MYHLLKWSLLMSYSDLIQELQIRTFIAQITNKQVLINQLLQNSISLYCGFDPTADSLHIGHLIPLLCLKHFQLAGHRPIVLIGGATGLIGDPSFKITERKLNNFNIVEEWVEKIKNQLSLFLDFKCGNNSAIITNNYDWLSTMNILIFLRKIGKYFSVNQMINKETIKHRLQRYNSGLSFTEFSYNLLQSYDFVYLNKQYGVRLQVGGSDQWGNIISGIDLTRRLNKNNVFGLTLDLITNTDGTKLGKTERNTIWLDPNKTSPYKFYQYWINTTDHNVYRFLKLFTFFEVSHINKIEKIYKQNNELRYAQFLLAEEMTRIDRKSVV